MGFTILVILIWGLSDLFFKLKFKSMCFNVIIRKFPPLLLRRRDTHAHLGLQEVMWLGAKVGTLENTNSWMCLTLRVMWRMWWISKPREPSISLGSAPSYIVKPGVRGPLLMSRRTDVREQGRWRGDRGQGSPGHWLHPKPRLSATMLASSLSHWVWIYTSFSC